MEELNIIQNFDGANTRNPGGNKDEPRVNEKITSLQIRLIDENGINVGLMPVREALRRANEAGLDLVEISCSPAGSVCKIMDAGKYKYELQKRKNEAKKKQKVQETKEIKFTPNIGVLAKPGFKMGINYSIRYIIHAGKDLKPEEKLIGYFGFGISY